MKLANERQYVRSLEQMLAIATELKARPKEIKLSESRIARFFQRGANLLLHVKMLEDLEKRANSGEVGGTPLLPFRLKDGTLISNSPGSNQHRSYDHIDYLDHH